MANRHCIMSLLFLSALLSPILLADCLCPSPEYIVPCMCRDYSDGPIMMCTNITRGEELISPIQGTEHYQIFSLMIINSSLLYLPHDVFINTHFERIWFVDSQLMSLSDGLLAFVGLENSLEEIHATSAHYITQWDWSQLTGLLKLKLIDISNIGMYSVDQEMTELQNLMSLGINKARISYIEPTAFSKLKKLVHLRLAGNEITEMSRAMLPDPAPELFVIDLSDNQLESLPDDMFTNMPSLKDVEISNNKFVTLKEETFRRLFENLQTLMLIGNEIRCDCRLKWIVNVRKPRYFKAECSLPENMKGVSLENVYEKSLTC